MIAWSADLQAVNTAQHNLLPLTASVLWYNLRMTLLPVLRLRPFRVTASFPLCIEEPSS